MTVLVVLTVIVIVLLIAGLAVYLYWAGTLLDRIGAKLEGAAEIVHGIKSDAELIMPGVDHINRTGGVVAVAALLSLLIYLIKRIDHRVDSIAGTLTEAKANTASTVLIPQVATGVDAVLAEGLEHHLFLGRVLGKVKS